MSSSHEDAMTKPTIETILERINSLGQNLQGQISGLRKDFESLRSEVGSLTLLVGSLKTDVGALKTDFAALRDEFQLFRGEVEIRLDRIEGMTNQTRSEFLNFVLTSKSYLLESLRD